eukprot:366554-Chlamydomonas_euryale.AAC.11
MGNKAGRRGSTGGLPAGHAMPPGAPHLADQPHLLRRRHRVVNRRHAVQQRGTVRADEQNVDGGVGLGEAGAATEAGAEAQAVDRLLRDGL